MRTDQTFRKTLNITYHLFLRRNGHVFGLSSSPQQSFIENLGFALSRVARLFPLFMAPKCATRVGLNSLREGLWEAVTKNASPTYKNCY